MPTKTPEEYAKKPILCPVCEQVNTVIGLDDPESNDKEGTMTQKVECQSCGSTWTDNYKIIGYSDLKINNMDER